MSYVGTSVHIHASKEQVWQVLANLPGVQNYSAFVSNAYYTSAAHAGVGCSRICELPGMKVEETAVEWQPGEYYRLKMEVLDGQKPPVNNLIFTLRIEDRGEYVIVWNEATYEMKLGLVGKLLEQLIIKRQFRQTMERVLDGLKYHIETGDAVLDPKALEHVPAVAVSV